MTEIDCTEVVVVLDKLWMHDGVEHWQHQLLIVVQGSPIVL